ncbi:MAG: alpha/beta fold hydrolase [Anaerolineae bacterium]|nr:alpha/beta fold hydrolase [Anaerolineae bacterium]
MTPQARWQTWQARFPWLRWWETTLTATGPLSLIAVFFLLPAFWPGLGEGQPAQQLADPEGAFITVDGVELYYIHSAVPGATPVVFVHGFGGSTVDWEHILPRVAAAGYDAYALDLPGFGLSEKGLDLNLGHPAQADSIAAWMAALELDAAHIVGHSMGGSIALHLAQRHPERVHSLGLVAPSLVGAETAGLPEALTESELIQRWTELLLAWVLPASAEIQLRSAAYRDEAITEELVEDYRRVFETEGWELSLLAVGRDAGQNVLEAPLSSITAPVALLWGAEDGWVPPSEGDRLQAALPNAERITFEEVGHLPMHEIPTEFTQALLTFWASLD